MKEKDKIFELVNKLANIFSYCSGVLQYDVNSQNEVNVLMKELGNITNLFNTNIKNETKNIKGELTIIDKKTGEKKELVSIESMKHRVVNVINNNNIYSCLKSLALSNKLAHLYDGNIRKCKNEFIHYYNIIFSNNKIDNINFMEEFSISFHELVGKDKYNCNMLSDNQFDKIYNLLSNNNSKVDKGAKINVLKTLGVEFNIKDDNDINKKFNDLCKDNERVVTSYLIKKYKDGEDYTNFENNMFSVKDKFISMIGQLLCKNEFKNTPYQLIKTPDATPGFEHMLIIDDKSLSYYIEVHMPDFIANKLMKMYGMKYSEERQFQKLGASAVYCREKKEIKNIFDALKNNSLKKPVRAQIISRDYVERRDGAPNEDGEPNAENVGDKNDDYYIFVTNEIIDEPSLFEEFLKNDSSYYKFVENSKLKYFNENVSIIETKNINKKIYSYMYDNFDNYQKKKFIDFSLNELKNGDIFNKKMFDKVYNNNFDEKIDDVAKLFINLDNYKYDFVKKNKNELNKYINKEYKNIDDINENKEMIKKYIDDYLDEQLENLNIINKSNKRR